MWKLFCDCASISKISQVLYVCELYIAAGSCWSRKRHSIIFITKWTKSGEARTLKSWKRCFPDIRPIFRPWRWYTRPHYNFGLGVDHDRIMAFPTVYNVQVDVAVSVKQMYDISAFRPSIQRFRTFFSNAMYFKYFECSSCWSNKLRRSVLSFDCEKTDLFALFPSFWTHMGKESSWRAHFGVVT